VILWFLSSFPGAPDGATEPAIYYSLRRFDRASNRTAAGSDWLQLADRHCLGAGLAAREVAVAALGTVYALSGEEGAVVEALA
jgi:ferrous iron transport protein B